MKVLSCFDGMACGRVALQRAGIQIEKYYASEIDKYAIKVAMKNWPDIVQLGDIEKWKSWQIEQPDLIIGGSPCQGFSNAGEGLNFEDPRSRLFFTFVDILRHYQPKWFLLENVKMKKEWRDVITSYMGVEPILIDSTLLSAQHRERLYWTNIPGITQPEDRHIYLKDIILTGEPIRDKSYTIDAGYHKKGSIKNHGTKPFHLQRESERRMMVVEIPEEWMNL